MKRIHNTYAESLMFRNYRQFNFNGINNKPEGLWYGIDNSWTDYCNKYFKEWIYKNNFELELIEENIKIIDSVVAINEITGLYGDKYKKINWENVSEKYDGIEVINYDLIMKNSLGDLPEWYRHWELNSGCIWNFKSILNVKKLD